MTHYFYKSEAPAVVAIVQEFYAQKAKQAEAMERLGQIFGGKVAPMRSISTLYAGGVELSPSRDLDVHWRRPDERGYRDLRTKPLIPKGVAKEERAAIRAEHERLLALWAEHCPAHISIDNYWDALGINLGNIWFCGGIKFALEGAAYFCLGFQLTQAKHDEAAVTGNWIEGAVEILPSEYEAARQQVVKGGGQ